VVVLAERRLPKRLKRPLIRCECVLPARERSDHPDGDIGRDSSDGLSMRLSSSYGMEPVMADICVFGGLPLLGSIKLDTFGRERRKFKA
jgi:hypothetical protein